MNRCKACLARQARSASVPTLKRVLILLNTGEDECEEDNEFIRWVHRAGHVSSMMSLRDRASAADVRLEQNLRYDFVKLKAKVKIRTTQGRYAPVERHVSAIASTVVKWGCKFVQSHHY